MDFSPGPGAKNTDFYIKSLPLTFPFRAVVHPQHLRSRIPINESTLSAVALIRECQDGRCAYHVKRWELLTPLIYTCDRVMLLWLQGGTYVNYDSTLSLPPPSLLSLVLFALIMRIKREQITSLNWICCGVKAQEHSILTKWIQLTQ